MARGEKSQAKKVKINISDRDFFLGLVQGDHWALASRQVFILICSTPHKGGSGGCMRLDVLIVYLDWARGGGHNRGKRHVCPSRCRGSNIFQ